MNKAIVLIATKLIHPVAMALAIPPETVMMEKELPINLVNEYFFIGFFISPAFSVIDFIIRF